MWQWILRQSSAVVQVFASNRQQLHISLWFLCICRPGYLRFIITVNQYFIVTYFTYCVQTVCKSYLLCCHLYSPASRSYVIVCCEQDSKISLYFWKYRKCHVIFDIFHIFKTLLYLNAVLTTYIELIQYLLIITSYFCLNSLQINCQSWWTDSL